MALKYVRFLLYFAVYGALGFHFQVLKVFRSEKSMNVAGSPVDRADRRAGALGFVATSQASEFVVDHAVRLRARREAVYRVDRGLVGRLELAADEAAAEG